MVENSAAPRASASIVLDARALGRFTGETPEPRPGLSSGHIPHSLPLPFSDLLEPATDDRAYTQFKPVAELRKILVDAVGGETVWNEVNASGAPLTFSCGSGMTAAVLWYAQQLVAEAEGRAPPQAHIYDESWTGYAQRKESKIDKGEPAK
jgi:thiosulfate/3-mercaptopyruvate sulfurtransferase